MAGTQATYDFRKSDALPIIGLKRAWRIINYDGEPSENVNLGGKLAKTLVYQFSASLVSGLLVGVTFSGLENLIS